MAEERRVETRAKDVEVPSSEVRARLMAHVAMGPYQEWRKRRAEAAQAAPA